MWHVNMVWLNFSWLVWYVDMAFGTWLGWLIPSTHESSSFLIMVEIRAQSKNFNPQEYLHFDTFSDWTYRLRGLVSF